MAPLPAGICLLYSAWGLTKASWQATPFWKGLWVSAVAVVLGCVGAAESRILVLLGGEGLVSPCGQVGSPALLWAGFALIQIVLLGLCVWGMEPGGKKVPEEHAREGGHWLGHTLLTSMLPLAM